MSMLPATQGQAADDSGVELAMAALRSERRNRPRFEMVLALLVLVVMVVYLLWTLAGRASASASLSRATSSLVAVQGVVAQLQAMEAQRANPRFEPDNDMVGKLQRFAASVGLPRPEVNSRDSTTTANVKGFVKRTYATNIHEATPELLLQWVAESIDGRFPGLELENLKLNPGRTLETGKVAWNLEVIFRRWERQP